MLLIHIPSSPSLPSPNITSHLSGWQGITAGLGEATSLSLLSHPYPAFLRLSFPRPSKGSTFQAFKLGFWVFHLVDPYFLLFHATKHQLTLPKSLSNPSICILLPLFANVVSMMKYFVFKPFIHNMYIEGPYAPIPSILISRCFFFKFLYYLIFIDLFFVFSTLNM